MAKILVTGSASGLGLLITNELRKQGHAVLEYDAKEGHDVVNPSLGISVVPSLDVLINCAGINYINWMRDITEEQFSEIMGVNCYGIFAMTQALHPALKAAKGTVINIVSNAAKMPMRCSAAYNASKGAALTLTKQMARELIDDDITVFSISPNKLKGTAMSDSIDEQVCRTRGWTKEEAQRYQLNGLLTKKETDPQKLAEFIAYLLQSKSNHEMFAGCDIQYGL